MRRLRLLQFSLHSILTCSLLFMAAPGLAATPSAPAAAVKKSKAPVSAVRDPSAQGNPEDLAPPSWTAKRFVFLDMPPMYRKFGYELYATAKLGAQTGPLDSTVVLKNRRLRYEPFRGRSATVAAVTRADSGEYLVEMAVDSSTVRVFARTRSQAVKGVAPADDIERARARWAGKTVYSRRGFISITDSTAAVITTARVTIQTPLAVTGVRAGVSPLPTQHIWVMVETPGKERGFIPTHLTWTNVMTGSRRECRPWEDDLLEQEPLAARKWDAATWDAVNAHNVFADMTRDQVLLSWGHPLSRDSAQADGKRQERWIYQGQYLYFNGERVATIENR